MSGFVGDGSRRFEAVGELDFSRGTATDLVELIDVTLRYLSERVPGGPRVGALKVRYSQINPKQFCNGDEPEHLSVDRHEVNGRG